MVALFAPRQRCRHSPVERRLLDDPLQGSWPLAVLTTEAEAVGVSAVGRGSAAGKRRGSHQTTLRMLTDS